LEPVEIATPPEPEPEPEPEAERACERRRRARATPRGRSTQSHIGSAGNRSARKSSSARSAADISLRDV